MVHQLNLLVMLLLSVCVRKGRVVGTAVKLLRAELSLCPTGSPLLQVFVIAELKMSVHSPTKASEHTD